MPVLFTPFCRQHPQADNHRRAATVKIAAAEGRMMREKQQLLLVDGSGYIFRAFHALPPMTRRWHPSKYCLWLYCDADEAG